MQYVAILQKNDYSKRKAVIVPSGQSLEMDEGKPTRKWLWPYLGGGWHLTEFLEIEVITLGGRDGTAKQAVKD